MQSTVKKEDFEKLIAEMDHVVSQIRTQEHQKIYKASALKFGQSIMVEGMGRVSSFAPHRFEAEQHKDLIEKMKFYIEKYVALKSFIIDVHISNMLYKNYNMGSVTLSDMDKQKQEMIKEMEEVIQNAMTLTVKVAQMPICFDRDMACQELEDMIETLENRVNQYTYLQQSYLTDLRYSA